MISLIIVSAKVLPAQILLPVPKIKNAKACLFLPEGVSERGE